MKHRIRALRSDDYPEVWTLWTNSEGVGLNESDSEPAVASFLQRNPEMSAVAIVDGVIVGAVLCGHDGRRGYLHHLAVEKSHRGDGIGKALVQWCKERLKSNGIDKCNIFLYAENVTGEAFWRHAGWNPRDDLRVLQTPL